MYQKGRHDGSRYSQVDLDSEGEMSDESEGYGHGHQAPDDLEMELYQPLDPLKHKP